ncbi:unnamed protein product [Thelazia callipaeda]|uniref:WGR domain-containing protein n=1 Tax=Thelazia callipaeda TaxID=103827 RepID=A0A0N5CPX4_THECL|nr:unnamed protein product [Thelazia callipaeda]
MELCEWYGSNYARMYLFIWTGNDGQLVVQMRGTVGLVYHCSCCDAGKKIVENTSYTENRLKEDTRKHIRKNNNGKYRPVSKNSKGLDSSAYGHWRCKDYIQWQLLDVKRRKEIELLRNCWQYLRQNIRQMFRDALNRNITSTEGKRFDVNKIKENVTMYA